MKIAIVGGAAAGALASLMLGRAGHEVVVLEQDRLEPAPDVESAAASAFRPAAPQIVQPPHDRGQGPGSFFGSGCRMCMTRYWPAGVSEAPVATQMPASLSDTAARPGDERLTMLMTRRSTVDWVLHRAILSEPRVTMRCGVRVTGLLTVLACCCGWPACGPARVTLLRISWSTRRGAARRSTAG